MVTPRAESRSRREKRPTKPKILCVDDEPNILKGLVMNLRRTYKVTTATSGKEGLEAISSHGPFAVIMSDMRMPEMNGATFLARAREMAPNTTRMLLTGQSGLDDAIKAINEGQIFRFLTKPCSPTQLQAAFEAANTQHRLVTAERELLEHTLKGSIKALTDLLALAQPQAFGKLNKIKANAIKLATELNVSDLWQIETAIMLSRIGCVSLLPETLEKMNQGLSLEKDEFEQVKRLPAMAVDLLGNIPRIEPILALLTALSHPFEEATPTEARLLKIVLDFEVLKTHHKSPGRTFDAMSKLPEWYDPAILKVFTVLIESDPDQSTIVEVDVFDLAEGMVLAADVRSPRGLLLVTEGYEVTEAVLQRLRNFGVQDTVSIVRS